ncbi:MAG: PDZ domain-containing protein [Ignavibacteriaceae bacterium]
MKSIITFFSLIFLCNLSAQTQSVLSLGMKLSVYQDWLYVSEVTQGDPAAKAGVLVNDYITQIDNHNAYKMNIDVAIKLLDGIGGTKVNVQTFRNNNYYNYTLVRADLEDEDIFWNDLFGTDYGTNSQDSTAESIGIKIDANEGWLYIIATTSNEAEVLFSAWDYAKSRCDELCTTIQDRDDES